MDTLSAFNTVAHSAATSQQAAQLAAQHQRLLKQFETEQTARVANEAKHANALIQVAKTAAAKRPLKKGEVVVTIEVNLPAEVAALQGQDQTIDGFDQGKGSIVIDFADLLRSALDTAKAKSMLDGTLANVPFIAESIKVAETRIIKALADGTMTEEQAETKTTPCLFQFPQLEPSDSTTTTPTTSDSTQDSPTPPTTSNGTQDSPSPAA